jgi:putative nucleotidyltransferase with HDIG domain
MVDGQSIYNPLAFFKIRINSIHPSSPVPFDLFLIVNQRMVHYLRAGDHLTAQKLLKFDNKAPDSFFIRSGDREKYKHYIHTIISSDRINPAEKALVLKESAFSLIEELFEAPNIKHVLAESKKIVNDFIDLMQSEPSAMANLIGLSSHDFYTYNHSLDVCIYRLGLGQILGINGQDLHTLGQGALFHDIGKRFLKPEIITKEGPLDEAEWEEMKKHPVYGLNILTEHNMNEIVKACCFEHHESRVGNGYPQGLVGNEIHPFARIVAISDTYDALTTKRSYQPPMSPTDAIELMRGKLAGRFDEDMMKVMYHCFMQMKNAG